MTWIIAVFVILVVIAISKPTDTPEQKENSKRRIEEQTNPGYKLAFEKTIKSKYDADIANKILNNKVELGITEEQFDEILEYQYYLGNFQLKNEFPFRQHEIMKTKTKTIRRRRKTKYSGEQEFIFNNGELVKIISN